MRRFLFALLATLTAAIASAAEPMVVRTTVYLRLPRIVSNVDAPLPLNPSKLLTAPEGTWPASYDAIKAALAKRAKNLRRVMITQILPAKPLSASESAAFFIPELGQAMEVKQEGDNISVLLPKATQPLTLPALPFVTNIFGADDELVYLGVTLVPASKLVDDTMVIMNGEKPLSIVSRVEPLYPKIEELRNRTGSFLSQLKVEKDGSVSDICVLERVNPQIEAVAVEAMKKWRFEAPTHDGHPVTAYMVMSTVWKID